MIPEFPAFKKLELSDKQDIENITKQYPPYSDFNFTSLWVWDIHEERKISLLHGNLVVWFTDYSTNEPFLSFLGTHKREETAQTLLAYAAANGLPHELRLVPEIVVQGMQESIFAMPEDRDNFDYIVSVERLLLRDKSPKNLSTRRKLVRKFLEQKGVRISNIDFRDASVQSDIVGVFHAWEAQLRVKHHDIDHLFQVLQKILATEDVSTFMTFGIYLNEVLVGYSINEQLPGDYLIGHFQQADLTKSQGMYALLMQVAAQGAKDTNHTCINIEQDLGLEGLRYWKSSYAPTTYLKKYIVHLRG